MQPLGPLCARRPTHIYTRSNTHARGNRRNKPPCTASTDCHPRGRACVFVCVKIISPDHDLHLSVGGAVVPATTHALTKTTTNACRDKLKF